VLYVRLLNLHSHLSIKRGHPPSVAQVATQTRIGPTPDNSCIHVNILLELNGAAEGGGADDSVLKIAIEYQCVYSVHKGVSINKLLPRAKEIAAAGNMMAWPYMRELVQTITSRMQIPPFLLPILVPQDIQEDKNP
jgi:preprotein translocase subunit SecB